MEGLDGDFLTVAAFFFATGFTLAGLETFLGAAGFFGGVVVLGNDFFPTVDFVDAGFAFIDFARVVEVAFFFAVMGNEFREYTASTELGKHFGTSRRDFTPRFHINQLRNPTPTTRTSGTWCVLCSDIISTFRRKVFYHYRGDNK